MHFRNVLYFFSTVRSADGDDEEEVVHMGNAIMSFYSALIDLLGRCAPEMHVRLMENVYLFVIFPLQIFTSFLSFSSSTRGKAKLCVFVPSCALWCLLKILWELSAYRSKCPSPTKVLVSLITQNILCNVQRTHPVHLHATTGYRAHMKVQWFTKVCTFIARRKVIDHISLLMPF